MSDLDQLVPDARAFLAELSADNTRDWFTAHKDRYERDLKAPALALLDIVAADLSRQTGAAVETKLFRPNRDVRFSKDKTPYHTHLHLLWTTPGMGYFFGISGDYITAGGGRMEMSKDALTAFRAAAETRGARMQDTLDDLAAQGYRLSEPELKRVPAPFDKDHPQGALLRRKSLTAWRDFDAAPADLPATLGRTFAALAPLHRMLADV